MKKIILSVGLIVLAIILSVKTSPIVGDLYSKMFPMSVGGGVIGTDSAWNSMIGLPLTLIFFLVIFTYKLVFQSKKSVLWLISPLILFAFASDLGHFYVPIILILLAFFVSFLIRSIIAKSRHHNLPMVINK